MIADNHDCDADITTGSRPQGSGSVAVRGGGWALFVDWCAAVGVEPVDADDALLARFVGSMSYAPLTTRRVLREVLVQLSRLGAAVSPPKRSELDRVWRTPDDVWDDVGGTLSRVEPQAGWPAGLRERRDGWVMVWLAAGLTRRAVSRLSPAGVAAVKVVDVADDPGVAAAVRATFRGRATVLDQVDDDPARCALCAVTRWLRVVEASERVGRGGTQQLLRGEPAGWHRDFHDHEVPLAGRWREATWLTVPVTAEGWLESFQPLSTRSVTAVAARRQLRSTARRGEWVEPVRAAPADAADDATDWDELDARLDVIIAEADRVLRASTEAMNAAAPVDR